MNDNQEHLLIDKEIVPTEELIFSLIGFNKIFWQRIMKAAAENCIGATGSWNYYADGKRWLFKFVHKKKTLFWAGIVNGTFRITFWFADKAEPYINDAILPPSVKDEFQSAKKYGSVRPVSIIVREQADADNVITLISVKCRVK